MLLHGEQYLAIKAPIPTSGTLSNQPRIMEVLDKGKSATVITLVETRDEKGNVIFESHSTLFMRGCGGFGGKKKQTGAFITVFKYGLPVKQCL